MPGSVITFYSYKGGVGRSFALANIATILAQWGSNVLVVDWDIEAPGLNHYFAEYASPMRAGVLDFIHDCAHDRPRVWTEYVTRVELPEGIGTSTDYAGRRRRRRLCGARAAIGLGRSIPKARLRYAARIPACFVGGDLDIVLVDSRTGVTDFSGLTTAQLPDILAFMFTANKQSLHGCADIARRAMEARRHMPIDRPALLPLPIPGRFEQREEYDRAQDWRTLFAKELKPFLDTWVPPGTDCLKLIDLLCIPYVPRWTFGEDLAALIEPAGTSGTRSPSQSATYALETLAALLLHKFSKIDLLASSRDEYVHEARSTAMNRPPGNHEPLRVFFSYSKNDQHAQEVVSRIVEASWGMVEPLTDSGIISPGDQGSNVLQEQIERADACIAIVGPAFVQSPWQQKETEWFLRQTLRSSQRKPIIPVVLKGGEDAFSSSRLADYNAVFLDNSSDPGEFGRILTKLDQLRTNRG